MFCIDNQRLRNYNVVQKSVANLKKTEMLKQLYDTETISWPEDRLKKICSSRMSDRLFARLGALSFVDRSSLLESTICSQMIVLDFFKSSFFISFLSERVTWTHKKGDRYRGREEPLEKEWQRASKVAGLSWRTIRKVSVRPSVRRPRRPNEAGTRVWVVSVQSFEVGTRMREYDVSQVLARFGSRLYVRALVDIEDKRPWSKAKKRAEGSELDEEEKGRIHGIEKILLSSTKKPVKWKWAPHHCIRYFCADPSFEYFWYFGRFAPDHTFI